VYFIVIVDSGIDEPQIYPEGGVSFDSFPLKDEKVAMSLSSNLKRKLTLTSRNICKIASEIGQSLTVPNTPEIGFNQSASTLKRSITRIKGAFAKIGDIEQIPTKNTLAINAALDAELITTDKLQKFAQSVNAKKYVEVSSISNENVRRVFDFAVVEAVLIGSWSDPNTCVIL
jgi:hypothetical protein